MTGAVWFKMMTYLGRERKFPGVPSLLSNALFNTLDKNRIPMAGLRFSLNLAQEGHSGMNTDGKSFVFVLQDVPMSLQTEEI
jgi:hypothetical protein